MTVPRSSGCTRTSSRWPRRPSTIRTRTSSGCSTMPLTRCSSAGRKAVSALRVGAGIARLLGLAHHSRSLGGRRLDRGLDRGRGRGLGLALGGLLGGFALWLLRLRQSGGCLGLCLVGSGAARPGGCHLERLRRGGQALELLPVAGLGENRDHRLARLCADGEPVLYPLGVDLDARGLLLGVVETDVLDRPAVTLGACVGND